jgi:uncharacterized protein
MQMLLYNYHLLQNIKIQESLGQLGHYVYAFVEVRDNSEDVFYIGKGRGNRCLEHLKNTSPNRELSARIHECVSNNRLRIDIVRHGLSDPQAKAIEATCIDLLNVKQLTNKIRGHGISLGRMSLEETLSAYSDIEPIEIPFEHRGLAFLLNKTYKSGMTSLELFEHTRGVWRGIPVKKNLPFAYATYAGIVKEVYAINCWLPAGTQQYFTRDQAKIECKTNRLEFVGSLASDKIRELYVGKKIKKQRSYAQPFVVVGLMD